MKWFRDIGPGVLIAAAFVQLLALLLDTH